MRTKKRRESNKIALNKTIVAELKVPETGRVYYHDSRVPGLAVCVTETGSRTFYIYRWHEGKPLRKRLGTTDELTVEQARDIARVDVGKLADGIDIQAEKRNAREEMTVGEMFTVWMEYAKEHKRTWPEDERKYNKFVAKWAARRLSTIDSTDIQRLHNSVKADSGPYQANRVLELVKAMFNRAIKLNLWKGSNPGAHVKKFGETSRERYLMPDEIGNFMAALEKAPADPRDLFKLLLLTGQRRGAVQAMAWHDVDLAGGTWIVPVKDSKSKRTVTVHLVPDAVKILKTRNKTRGEATYVFPSRSKTGHIVEPKKVWQDIRAKAGMEELRIHDLRRTVGSWLATSGATLNMIGEVLGHAPGSKATNVYARLMPSAVKASVASVTSSMMKVAKAKRAKHGKAR